MKNRILLHLAYTIVKQARASAVRYCLIYGTLLLASINHSSAAYPGIPDAPQLPLTAYVLIDYQSGAVLAEHNSDARMEPASLTKIMTVYTVADALKKGLIKLDDQTVISEHAWKQEGSRMFVEVNKSVAVDELLHGDIIQSGNDASVALAEHVSGTEEVFASVMNGHAARLGMKMSKFMNSTGLPNPEHYTTARDLSVLARALIEDFPDIYRIFHEPEYTYNGITQQNRNGLLRRDPSVDGIKTGHTEAAGYCLVASAERNNMRLISVVLGAESDAARTQASQSLLNYGYRFFESKQQYPAGAKVTAARVWKGTTRHVDVGVVGAVAATIPRGKAGEITVTAQLHKPLIAPLAVGQKVGELVIGMGEYEISRTPLVAQQEVLEGAWYERLLDAAKLYFE
jgi:serine-type D-Ala-D-Ala carboxypeptidase (penicillin-binding protein 5/6)